MMKRPKPTQAATSGSRSGQEGAGFRSVHGESVDNASEQHRLGELGGGQRHIGESKHPAEPDLRTEQAKDARIERKN